MDNKQYTVNMDIKLNPISKLEQFLERENYHIEKFDVETIGEYSKHDAIWNYKDTTHLDYVHSQADSCQSTLGDDIVTALHTQKIFGLKFPMCLIEYHRGEELNYFSTILLFTLLVRTRFEDFNKTGSRTITTYTVACPKWCKFFVRILKYVVIKNYKILMSEDIPMRERKLYLRRKGYSFTHDNTRISWLKTSSITQDYLILPENKTVNKKIININLDEINENRILIGESDHYGLQILKQDNKIYLFNRICYHEGACLDEALEKNGNIYCPWHGKKIAPLKEFNINDESFKIKSQGKVISKIEKKLTLEITND